MGEAFPQFHGDDLWRKNAKYSLTVDFYPLFYPHYPQDAPDFSMHIVHIGGMSGMIERMAVRVQGGGEVIHNCG